MIGLAGTLAAVAATVVAPVVASRAARPRESAIHRRRRATPGAAERISWL